MISGASLSMIICIALGAILVFIAMEFRNRRSDAKSDNLRLLTLRTQEARLEPKETASVASTELKLYHRDNDGMGTRISQSNIWRCPV